MIVINTKCFVDMKEKIEKFMNCCLKSSDWYFRKKTIHEKGYEAYRKRKWYLFFKYNCISIRWFLFPFFTSYLISSTVPYTNFCTSGVLISIYSVASFFSTNQWQQTKLFTQIAPLYWYVASDLMSWIFNDLINSKYGYELFSQLDCS